MKYIGVALAFMAGMGAVHAQSDSGVASKSPWHLVMKAGVNLGGGSDEIYKGYYTDGSSFSIKAGNGNAFALGVSYSVTPVMDLQLTVGNEKTTTSASNGELGFYRLPIELLGFYNYGDNWRLGGGLRVATDAKMKYRHDVAGDGEYTFRPAPSMVVEAQYLTDRYGNQYGRFGVAARVVLGETFERDYQAPNTSNFQPNNGSFNGSHFGVSLVYMY